MFYHWSCDLVAELPQTSKGNVYIMIMIEHFSKWVELVVLPDKSSHNTSHVFLQQVLSRFGACAECITNQGSEFRGKFQDLLDQSSDFKRQLQKTNIGGSYKPNVRQFDVGDFMYFQRQPNDTLDSFSDHTILRIKAIRPSSVLELQGANGCTIHDHSKNYAPYHLLNLNPNIITSTWIPPLDYPCHVCQKTKDVYQILFCDNYNGGYHLFCFKSKLIQVPVGIWYCSSCSPVTP